MNFIRQSGIISGLCLSAIALSAAPTYPEASLPELAELISQAGDQAPALVAQSIAREESLARLAQAKAAYYPSLDLNGNFGYRQEYRTDAEDTNNLGVNFGLYLRRPLYYWGAIEARIKQAGLDQKNEELEHIHTLRLTKRNIRADYLLLLLNRIEQRNALLRREVLQADKAVTDSRQKSGEISATEAEQSELNLLESLAQLDQLDADQTRIQADFKRTLGWKAPLTLTDPITTPDNAELQVWIASAKNQTSDTWTSENWEIGQRQNLIEREELELVRITSGQRPLLDFNASVGQGQSNTSTANNVDTTTLFVGIGLRWNIFDGFETKYKRIETRLRINRFERELTAYEAEIKAQAGNILTALEFQTRRLRIDERRFALAGDTLARSKQDLSSGLISDAQFKTKQLEHHEQELQLQRSRVALLLGISDYLDLTQPASAEELSNSSS